MSAVSYSSTLHNELARQGYCLKWREWQESGPAHAPLWSAIAIINDYDQCLGRGPTKSLAKEASAMLTLNRLGMSVAPRST